MKKYLLVFALLSVGSFCLAQKKDKASKDASAVPLTTTYTYVSADAKIEKFHTEEELKKLDHYLSNNCKEIKTHQDYCRQDYKFTSLLLN